MRSESMPGTNSTHLMQSGEADGKFIVSPTIFPNKDKSWTSPGEGNPSFDEAEKRGELFSFKSKKKAEKFAEGSWKKKKYRDKSNVTIKKK